MIYSPLSTPLRTKEFPLSATASLAQDGQAMVRNQSGLVFGVQPSANSATEQFVGFMFTQTSASPFLQTTAVKTERFVVPAGKTLTLSKTLVAASVFVWNVTGSAAVTPDSATGTTVDLTTGGTIGSVVDVTYRYNLTVAEARSRNGDVQPGGYAGLTTGTVTVMQAGTIYTDQFNTAANWVAATEVNLFTGGYVTDQAGTGVAINATIISLPSVDLPFLGLEFDAY